MAPDTRLNWKAIAELARPAAAPLSLATAEPACQPSTPKARLWTLLETWAGMDEAAWPEANVKALYDDIMDIFQDHPGKADAWFNEWRAAHPRSASHESKK